MSGFFLKAASAALAVALASGASRAIAISVDIAGGTSADVGGWQITTDPGVTLTGVLLNSTTLLIDNKSETFSNGAGQSVSFTQIDADAAPSIEFATATIQNSTGSDWTGFNFSVTGPAVFDGVGNVFAPPLSSGVNYTSVTLNITHNLLAYSGAQSNGATSNWGSNNPGDDLLIDATTSSEAPFADFSLQESPVGASISQVVPAPSAAGLSLAGLLVLGLMSIARKVATVHA